MKSTSCSVPGTVVSGKYWFIFGVQWIFAILAPSGKGLPLPGMAASLGYHATLGGRRVGDNSHPHGSVAAGARATAHSVRAINGSDDPIRSPRRRAQETAAGS